MQEMDAPLLFDGLADDDDILALLYEEAAYCPSHDI